MGNSKTYISNSKIGTTVRRPELGYIDTSYILLITALFAAIGI